MLERREGETEFEHHKRLVYGKLVDKTLADVDYTELAPVVYGQEYSADVARRMMYGSRVTLDLLEQDRESRVATDPDIAGEITAQRIALAKERQRFFDQRREFNKLVAADGRREYLEDRLVSAAQELNKTVGLVFKGNSIPECFDYEDAVNEAVLVFCDWHYGMVTNNVFNQYNTEICKERVETIVNGAIDRIRLHHCRAVHIVVLGDLFHGAIHTSARVCSEELACDQLMQVSEILAQAILKLSYYTGKVYVHMTYGNHARTVQDKRDSVHRDNMERIIPWWLKQRFAGNEKIEISNDSQNEFVLVNVCGYSFCATHGDLDMVRTSPRMLYTLFQKQYGIDLNYVLLGDKHHYESFSELGVDAMIVGALCGTDDYANEHRLYSRPSQLMLIVSEEEGVDAEYKLKC